MLSPRDERNTAVDMLYCCRSFYFLSSKGKGRVANKYDNMNTTTMSTHFEQTNRCINFHNEISPNVNLQQI